MMIQDEGILVNGHVCTQRGKKLRRDDRVEILGYKEFIVV